MAPRLNIVVAVGVLLAVAVGVSGEMGTAVAMVDAPVAAESGLARAPRKLYFLDWLCEEMNICSHNPAWGASAMVDECIAWDSLNDRFEAVKAEASAEKDKLASLRGEYDALEAFLEGDNASFYDVEVKMECSGAEEKQGENLTLLGCAQKCQSKSAYFIFGRYGTNRCDDNGTRCHCYCETAAAPHKASRCSKKAHTKFDLYKFAGVARLPKECVTEAPVLPTEKRGMCLDATQRNTNRGKVWMWPCNPANQNQQWTYDARTKQIKATHGLCLDSPRGGKRGRGGEVYMWKCNPKNRNQQWIYDAAKKQFKHAKHGVCLDTPGRTTQKGTVQTWNCHDDNPNQHFTYDAATQQIKATDSVHGDGVGECVTNKRLADVPVPSSIHGADAALEFCNRTCANDHECGFFKKAKQQDHLWLGDTVTCAESDSVAHGRRMMFGDASSWTAVDCENICKALGDSCKMWSFDRFAATEKCQFYGTTCTRTQPEDGTPRLPPPTLPVARYIRISGLVADAKGKAILNLAEVRAYDSAGAYIAPLYATLSSIRNNKYNDHGGRCIDGNIEGKLRGGGKFCHSDPKDPNPYLIIDLGQLTSVSKIEVFNRGDCCQDRIEGATIELLRDMYPTQGCADGVNRKWFYSNRPGGCAAAVWKNGKQAEDYCIGDHPTRSDANAFFAQCCSWENGACTPKAGDATWTDVFVGEHGKYTWRLSQSAGNAVPLREFIDDRAMANYPSTDFSEGVYDDLKRAGRSTRVFFAVGRPTTDACLRWDNAQKTCDATKNGVLTTYSHSGLASSSNPDGFSRTYKIERQCSNANRKAQARAKTAMAALGPRVTALQAEVEASVAKAERIKSQLDSNYCDDIMGVITRLIDSMNGWKCLLVNLGMTIVGAAIDKVLGWKNPAIKALQAQPRCEAFIGIPLTRFRTAQFLLDNVARNAFKAFMCGIQEDVPAIDGMKTDPREDPGLGAVCAGGEIGAALRVAAMSVSCGYYAAALLAFVKPIVLCNLPWAPDGGMCQTNACFTGPNRIGGNGGNRRLEHPPFMLPAP